MTTDDELRALIALGEKATARPWSADWDTAKFTHNFKIEYCGWAETPTISGASVSEIEPQVEADRLYMEAAANLAPEIAAELIAAREEIQRLRVALESLRITSHTECEDCWYSCPKSDDYCGTDDREHCACGMDKQNAIIDAALNGGDA